MAAHARARLSDPGRGIRRSRSGDLAASARARGRSLRVGGRSALCTPRADHARGRRAQVRSSAGPGMERPSGAGHDPRRRVRLERLRLPQPFAGRQGGHRHELEWAPLLWAEGGEEWRVQQKEERHVRTEPIPRYWHVPNAGRIRARNAESFVASRNEEVGFNISERLAFATDRQERTPRSVKSLAQGPAIRPQRLPATSSSRAGGRTMKRDERKVALRCAVYTRVSTDSGLEQELSTPSTTSARPRRPTSKAKPMRDGSLSANAMTTAAFREVRWSDRRSRSCWRMSGPARSTSIMKAQTTKQGLRCAIYTRVSTDQGLEQDFNSLDAQREAFEAYIKSQAHEGWRLVRDRYDDGGFSGGSMDRPALQKLLIEVRARRIDVIVVYKVDRLTRSLADFAKLVETFDAHSVSFVSVTQSFNTTTSMGRLTLNVLLSFAQFEREVTGERIRDKIAASKKKGIWMGGVVPLGYRIQNRALHIVDEHAEFVRILFRRYLEIESVVQLKAIIDGENLRLPVRADRAGRSTGGGLLSRGHIYKILSNPIYIGRIAHKGHVHEGQHSPIIERDLWDRVQRRLQDHVATAKTRRVTQSSDSLLAGKLFDDRGNRMSPSWARKGSKRWRYYVSQAVLQGEKAKAGSVARVPAAEIESRIVDALGKIEPRLGSGARSVDDNQVEKSPTS